MWLYADITIIYRVETRLRLDYALFSIGYSRMNSIMKMLQQFIYDPLNDKADFVVRPDQGIPLKFASSS